MNLIAISLWPSAYQSYPIPGSSSIVAGVCSGKSAQSMAMNAAQTNNPAEIAGPMVKIMSDICYPLKVRWEQYGVGRKRRL